MRARYAREIRAGINSVRVPYLAWGCHKHGYSSVLDFEKLRRNMMESAVFEGSPLYHAARIRTRHEATQREVSCWECA